MRIELSKFHFFQISGFVLSAFITVLLIRALGKESYGQYSYYLTLADLLSASILLGYDQSINLIKNISKLPAYEKASIVFSSKIIIYLLLIPAPFIFINNGIQLIFFTLIIMSISLFDLSYFYMINHDLNKIAFNYLISKLIFLLSVLLLFQVANNYQNYLLAYAFSFGIYVLLGNLNNKINKLFYLNFSLLRGFNQVKLALPFGFSRIFIFIEMFIVLTIFRDLLSPEDFGIFMISYSIAKLISGAIGIFITPIYNKITLSLISMKEALLELFIVGSVSFSMIFAIYFIYYLSDTQLISNIFNIQYYEFNSILEKSLIYAVVLYLTSVIYNIFILAINRPIFYYIIRTIFIFNLYLLINVFNYTNKFNYLIVSELLILSLVTIYTLIKTDSKI